MSPKPSLYGISAENCSRQGSDLWGKNQFNSTFPLALCLYMRDKKISPVSVLVNEGDIQTTDGHWSMEHVVGAKQDSPFYIFEESFTPYEGLSRNDVDHIDLVVMVKGKPFAPLEVKLTVVPDRLTAAEDEDLWSPEMVMRPVSSAYAMMGVVSKLRGSEIVDDVKYALRPAYNRISDWDNVSEISKNIEALRESLDNALMLVESLQIPFILQPIWRTDGQSLALSEQCFDVFVWSNVAVMRIPIKESEKNKKGEKVTRWTREIARYVHSLYTAIQMGDYDYAAIYKGMALGNQTDKSFSLRGPSSINYLAHDRLREPILPREKLKEIVLNGGENELKPERRFDAAVVRAFGYELRS